MHLNTSGIGCFPHLTQGKNKPAVKTSSREKVILIYSLYDQSTVDPEKDNETLPSKFLFSFTDPRGVFTNAPRGMIPTALSICSIVATRRASSLIRSFKEKQANFKGRAFLVVISEKKLQVTTETTTVSSAWMALRGGPQIKYFSHKNVARSSQSIETHQRINCPSIRPFLPLN